MSSKTSLGSLDEADWEMVVKGLSSALTLEIAVCGWTCR